MFSYERTRQGKVERWSVLVDAGDARRPPPHPRFGKAVRMWPRLGYVYELGFVLLVRGEDETEYVISVPDTVSEEERAVLVRDVERIAGREVHQLGSKWGRRLVLHDSLRSAASYARADTPRRAETKAAGGKRSANART